MKKAPKIASKNQLQSARINFSGVVFILTENGQIDSTTLGFYLKVAKKIKSIASILPFSILLLKKSFGPKLHSIF